ncbi:MAG: hypothetical protein JSS42_00685 [Proteobacteria bacterium]|nr:hypothetical protein [Pseudomonadota bacterium]
MEPTESIARKVFAEVAVRFPNLQMIEEQNPNVEISIVLPIQAGLKQEVWLGLNSDELCFAVDHFNLEWFPCTSPERVSAYIEAVSGFLSGEYRIVEYYRKAKCVKAHLQAPSNDEWKTIGTWQTIRLFSFAKHSIRIVRND